MRFFFFSKPNGYLHQTVHTFIAFHHFRIGFFNITHFLSFCIFSLISHLVDNNCIVKYCCCNLLPFTPAIRHSSEYHPNKHTQYMILKCFTHTYHDDMQRWTFYLLVLFFSQCDKFSKYLFMLNQPRHMRKKNIWKRMRSVFYDQCARKSSQWQKNKLELRWWR